MGIAGDIGPTVMVPNFLEESARSIQGAKEQ